MATAVGNMRRKWRHCFAAVIGVRKYTMKMAELSASESSPDTDRDFDPTAEMLVNDFDDERTLEEEEAMESSEDAQNELDDLQKEGDMPIEDLLTMYGYADGNQADNSQSSSSEEILSNQDLTLDKEEIARDLLHMDDDDDQEKEMSVHELLDTVDAAVPTSRLLRSAVLHHQSESESESDNGEYVPEEDDDWKKTIQVGLDFQAVIPEGLCRYDGAPAYENDDKLLWDPNKVLDGDVDNYLRKCQQPLNTSTPSVHSIPCGSHVRDDEQALYLLLQCGHSIEEAMRRRRMQAVQPTDTMSLWSEEECRSFENGLRTYGKDFHLIQQNKVRTRSVGELVQFYYLWKKTERHDVFANKTRLEKKKYTLHPGTTDYMDRFLDEQENPTQHRDRSSSPNIHSLISGDHKRQQQHGRTLSCSADDLSVTSRSSYSVSQNLAGQLPQRNNNKMADFNGQAAAGALAASGVVRLNEKSRITSPASEQPESVHHVHRHLHHHQQQQQQLIGDLAKHASVEFKVNNIGSLSLKVAVDGTGASPAESSNGAVCVVRHNSGGGRSHGDEVMHRGGSARKTLEVALSTVSSSANNLQQDVLLSGVPVKTSSPVQ